MPATPDNKPITPRRHATSEEKNPSPEELDEIGELDPADMTGPDELDEEGLPITYDDVVYEDDQGYLHGPIEKLKSPVIKTEHGYRLANEWGTAKDPNDQG